MHHVLMLGFGLCVQMNGFARDIVRPNVRWPEAKLVEVTDKCTARHVAWGLLAKWIVTLAILQFEVPSHKTAYNASGRR